MTNHGRFRTQDYHRLFPDLDPWAGSEEDILKLIDQCFATGQSDNPDIAAGITYFGQFIVHDLSFDAAPPDHVASASRASERTIALDLDSVYGGGPDVSPHFYDRTSYGRFLIPRTAEGHFDLQRNAQGTAIVADPRNDENLIVAQLHLAFQILHNRLRRAAQDEGLDAREAFAAAVRRLRWTYQWIILNRWLPAVMGRAAFDAMIAIDRARRRYRFDRRLPAAGAEQGLSREFAGAAMRFGHVMVRPSYRMADGGILPLFADSGPTMAGGQALTARQRIDWADFFDDSGGNAQRARRIVPALARPLASLPDQVPANLALRTLLRGVSYELPGGQQAARALGIPPVRPDHSDPLWFYILNEAQLVNDGRHLGPLAAAIVGETILSVMAGDGDSALNAGEAWDARWADADFATLPGTQPRADVLRSSGSNGKIWDRMAETLTHDRRIARTELVVAP